MLGDIRSPMCAKSGSTFRFWDGTTHGGGPGSKRETKLRSFIPAAKPGGVKRKAALGTSNTLSRLTVTMLAVAVMPGRNARSSLLTCKMVL